MSTNQFPSTGPKPKFDPNKKYEAVTDTPAPKKPKFDPNKAFDEVRPAEKTTAIPQFDFTKPIYQKPVQEEGQFIKAPKETATQPTAQPQAAPIPTLSASAEISSDGKGKKSYDTQIKGAQDVVFQELTTNDKAFENIIRRQRANVAEQTADIPRSDMPTANLRPNLPAQDQYAGSLPVTAEDIQKRKVEAINDPAIARRVLKEIADTQPEKAKAIKKAVYDLDRAAALENDPDGDSQFGFVQHGSKNIEKGDYDYDIVTGTLFKPLNAFQSAVQGWKQGSQVRDEFAIFGKMNDGQLATMLDAQMATNQGKSKYEAIEVPGGKVGEMLSGLTMSPATTAGGALGSLAGPEGALAAGSILGAGEMAQRDYVLNLKRVYSELRANGMDQLDAIKEAKSQALKAAGVGAVEGAAFGFLGARFGMKPLPKAALTSGFRNAVVNGLKGAGKTISTATKEGLAAGGLTAGGEMYKNSLAKDAGIDRDIDEGVAEAIESNLLFSLGMAGAMKAMKVGGKAYKSLISGLASADNAHITKALNEALSNKEITEAQATKLQSDIDAFRKEDATIPADVTPEARAQILEKIKKRDELEAKMESLDKAFHPEIKEKIKGLEEEINTLSKEKAEKPDKAITDLKKLIDDEIAEGNVHGYTKDALEGADPADLPGYMKDIADQANDPNSAAMAREIYGDAIVDRAIEMYPPKQEVEAPPITQEADAGAPLDRPEEKGGITVLQPKEIKQPRETVTIKPIETTQQQPFVEEQPQENTPPTPDEPKWSGVFIEDPKTELSLGGLQRVAGEFGLTEVKGRDSKTDLQLRTEADSQIREWQKKRTYFENIEDLTRKGESSQVLTDTERVIMERHLATLTSKMRQMDEGSPEYNAALRQLQRLTNAGAATRSAAGAALRIPSFKSNPLRSKEDAYVAKMEAAGVEELTPQQKEEVKAQVDKYQKAAAKAEKASAALDEKAAEAKASAEVEKVKKTKPSKSKTAEDYKADRIRAIEAAREALKKLRTGESGLSAVPLPGVRELAAIAPHVKDAMVALVHEGVIKLEDVVSRLHNEFKDVVDGITQKDIHNIIAGEFNEKRPPITELQQILRDLKEEAKLINELEALEAGKPPKDERAKRKRNQRIKELRDKIRAIKPKSDPDPEQSLTSIKQRNLKRAEEIRKQIAEGDLSKPEKKKSIFDDPEVKKNHAQLRQEALDAIAEREEAKKEFELALLKDEMAKRPLLTKGLDFAGKLVHTGKALMAGIDDSATFVQNFWNVLTNPQSGGKAWIDHWKDAFSPKRFEREIQAIRHSADWDIMDKSGLDVLDPNSTAEGKIEEMYEGNLLARKFRIKGKDYEPWKYTGGIFERAFTSLGNNLRVNLFRKRMQTLMDQGKTFESHPDEYKAAARVINEITGRGKQNKFVQQASPVITPFIWAPRMMASSLNQLGISDAVSYVGGKKFGTEGFYRKLTPEQRKYALVQFGKGVGLGVATMAAAAYAGAEVDFDPRSVTFGNVKIGTKSYNVFGRFAPYVKTVVQFTMGERVKPGGAVQDLDSGKFGAKTRVGVIGGFLRGKMTPFAGSMYDLAEGKQYFTNKPFGVKDLPEALLMPMSISELKKGWEQDGSISLLTRFLPAFEGIKVSDERDFEKPVSKSSSGKKGRGANRKTRTRKH